MPRSLKLHPNLRIDIEDMELAANTFTAESSAFFAERMLLAKRARSVEGFRIELSKQDVNPGEITIYNGYGFDRDGNVVNNEDQVEDARTITLVGASQTFYLEIEYTTEDAEPDARAFWDPVYDNPAPDPDGREFSITVPTRLASNWRVVTPVSTTGFEVTSTPTSLKIPLAVLTTNFVGEISGPGAVYVQAASVLEEDASATAGTIRVLNSRILPDTGTIIIGYGGATPETVVVSANNRNTGVLTFAPVLAANHSAGAIVREDGVSASFLKENTDPGAVATTGGATQPDAQRRVFQADEYRGTAVAQSKETFGARDDLNVESIKDYVDYLAAHIHEIRWGALRPDDNSQAPPVAFNAEPRYWEPAGGLMGARSHTMSIGNGTTSWGDFNGTTADVFNDAIAAMPATGGVIFVKRGTYTIDKVITVNKPVMFVGEGKNAVILAKSGAITYTFYFNPGTSTHICGMSDMSLTLAGASTALQVQIGTGTCFIRNAHIAGETAVATGAQATVIGENTTFFNNSGIGVERAFNVTGTALLYQSYFKDCVFNSAGTTALESGFYAAATTSLYYTTFETCLFLGYVGLDLGTATVVQLSVMNGTIQGRNRCIEMGGTSLNVSIANCTIETVGVVASDAAVFFGGNMNSVTVSNCYFTSAGWASVASVVAPNAFIYFNSATIKGVTAKNCVFTGTAGTTYVTGIRMVSVTSTDYALRVDGCDFYRCYGIFDVGLTAGSSVLVAGCTFNGDAQTRTNYGIYSDPAGSVNYLITGCTFEGQSSSSNATHPIYFNATGGASNINIANCVINSIGQTAGSYAAAIYVDADAFATVLDITNCTIKAVYGATGAYGIWLNATVPGVSLRVSNCHLDAIASTSSGDAVGIYAPNLTKSNIVGNRVVNIGGISSARCIWLTAPVDVTVSGNVFEDQIFMTGIMTRVIVSNNVIRSNTALSTGVVRVNYADTSSCVEVSGNTVHLSDTTFPYGVEIVGASGTAEIYQLNIVGNMITMGAGGGYGIVFVSGESFNTNIANNNIREVTTHVGTRAIYVSSATLQGHKSLVISGNNVYWATKVAHKAHAIHVVNAIAMSISNNTIWFGGGSFNGSCIYCDTVAGSIVGNTCSGTGTEATIINVINLASIVMVSGNFVDGSMGNINVRISVDGVGYNSAHGSLGYIDGGANGSYGHNVA